MPRVCEMCPEAAPIPASVFCPADQCYLCSTCDHVVHTANRLARRHVRRPLTATDSTDGSSINDESDARVPDVATPSVTAPPLLTTSATTKPTPTTPTTTTTTTTTTTATTVTTASTAPPSKTKDDDDVAVTFEDAADYDFCFDAIGPRMPALAADDMDDTLFADGKLARTFYPDMSWESVVPDAFEHVVPDVEAVSASRRDVDDTRSTLPVLFDSRDRDVRARDVKDEVHIDHLPVSEVDMDVAMDVPDLCDDKVPIKLETESDSPVVHPVKEETKKEVHASIKKEDHMDVCSSVCTKLESSLSKSDEDNQADANDDDDGDATQSDDKDKTDGDKAASSSSSAAEEDNALARAAEERKKRRMEALARFRSKRANRSFTKKVRYECRKQLADSRPRVKGRFVRKVEMALFRKYGALYREHLDELKTGADETVA